MLNLLLRRNWKLMAGLVVADFLYTKFKESRKNKSNLADAKEKETNTAESLRVSLKDLVGENGHHNRGSLAG